MRFFKAVFSTTFFITVALLVACSSNDEKLEPMELPYFEPQGKLRQLWKASVGEGQDRRYTLLVPAIAGDSIYASDVEGNVFAFDRNTGKRRWKVELDEPVSGGIGIGNGVLLLGTYSAEVIVLNTEDGSEKWRATVTSEVVSPPQTNGRLVAVQTFDGNLIGLDFNTGKQLWIYETINPLLTLRGSASPLIYGANIYAGFATGKVVSMQANDGLLLWEQRVAVPQGRGDYERMIDIDGSPILVGEILFVASFQGQIVAFSRATGRVLWSQPASTFVDLSAGQGNVYLTEADGRILAYSTGGGQLAWENNQLLRRKVSAPHAFASYVAVADEEDGYVHILSQSDGSFVARKKIDGSGVRSPMVHADNVLYIFSNDGKLVALEVVPNDS
jgi:outer membrane protein assembly factor BamB